MKNYNVYRIAALARLHALGITASVDAGPAKIAALICAVRKVSVVGTIRKGQARAIIKDFAEKECGVPVEVKQTHEPPQDNFFTSGAWRELRYRVLVAHGGRCQCCGRTASDGVVIHVDHIKPRSKHPELALDEKNLQVLCEDCNLGKSNKDDTDWRPRLVVNNRQP